MKMIYVEIYGISAKLCRINKDQKSNNTNSVRTSTHQCLTQSKFHFFFSSEDETIQEISQTCFMLPSKETVKYGHINQVVA
jgi:hypothetical protein